MKIKQTITGVQVKSLAPHKDKRGFFIELVQNTDKIFNKFAQLSHSMSQKGVTKAWHLHKKQTDLMYVATGDIKLALYDTRKKSKTFRNLLEIYMGQEHGRKIVKIPPGVAHGYKILNGPMHIIYLMDRVYDPKDELRIPHNDPEIGYNWKSTK